MSDVSANMGDVMKNAYFVGTLNGKRIHRWNIVARVSDLSGTVTVYDQDIVSESMSDAFEFAKEELIRIGIFQPVELFTVGPKGGRYERFMGWESLVWYHMLHNRSIGEAEQRRIKWTD